MKQIIICLLILLTGTALSAQKGQWAFYQRFHQRDHQSAGGTVRHFRVRIRLFAARSIQPVCTAHVYHQCRRGGHCDDKGQERASGIRHRVRVRGADWGDKAVLKGSALVSIRRAAGGADGVDCRRQCGGVSGVPTATYHPLITPASTGIETPSFCAANSSISGRTSSVSFTNL